MAFKSKGKGKDGIRGLKPFNFDFKTFDLNNASNVEKLLLKWDVFEKWRDSLTEEEKDHIDYNWEDFWARKNQREPKGDWGTWLLLMGRGGGKRLSIYTEIPTDSGFKTMGDLKVGDVVFDDKGKPCNITYVSPIEKEPDLYKVIFDDGNYIYADAEHNWYAYDFRARAARRRHKNPVLGPRVVTTEEIKNKLKYRGKEINWAIANCEAVEYSPKDLHFHPYYVGVWLAQTGFTFDEISISNRDVEIVDNIRKIGYAVRHHRDSPGKLKSTYRIGLDGGRNIKLELVIEDLTGEKHIPVKYLESSKKQRIQLLRGIMDVRGRISREDICLIDLEDNLFAKDVYELLCSLGIKVHAHQQGERVWYQFYSVEFKPSTLKRINHKLHRDRISPIFMYRYIMGVEKVSPIPARCISVDSPNNTYLCTRSYIVTHNTRTGAEWIRKRVESGAARKIAMIARSPAEVRDVMLRGPSGILATAHPDLVPIYNQSNRSLLWPNGAEALIFSSYEPDKLRGVQFDTAWCDELAAWKCLADTWNNLQMCLRMDDGLGGEPKCIVTTTPRPLKLIKEMCENNEIPKSLGSTFDNQRFLAKNYVKIIKETYDGTRLGKQELYGELLGDVQGALWTSNCIEENRIDFTLEPENFPGLSSFDKKLNFIKNKIVRIVIGVDPQMVGGVGIDGESEGDNCETGIVVAGIDANGQGYLLEDISRNCTPLEWAKVIVRAFHKYGADRIVAESNQGGDIIETTIRTIDENVCFKKVFAKKGKYLRAEPVSALYERNKICHFGPKEDYVKLETQMINWVPGQPSPDRLDALVYAFHELMLDGGPSFGGIILNPTDNEEYIVGRRKSTGLFDEMDGGNFFGTEDGNFFDASANLWD